MQETLEVRITKRDIAIFQLISKLKMLTVNQIAALFFVKPPRERWDMSKARSAAGKRISMLQRGEYLMSGYVPGTPGKKCYILGPEAVKLLKEDEELGALEDPRYFERKHTYAVYNSLHDLPCNSFVINLMLLSETRDDFYLDEVLGEKDCSFMIEGGKGTYNFKPDFYVQAGAGGMRRACFFEYDTGSVSAKKLQRKVYLHVRFIHEGMSEFLGLKYQPVMCFLVPDEKRVKFVGHQIRLIKSEYKGTYAKRLQGFPYFIAISKDMGIDALEEGRLTENPLHNKYWYDEDGDRFHSPFRDGGK